MAFIKNIAVMSDSTGEIYEEMKVDSEGLRTVNYYLDLIRKKYAITCIERSEQRPECLCVYVDQEIHDYLQSHEWIPPIY